MIRRLNCTILAAVLAFSLCGTASAKALEVVAPSGLLEEDGALIIADLYHRAVWRRDSNGTLTRLAGREGVKGVNGLPLGGYLDGVLEKAAFQTPWAVAPYLDGYAVTDTENHAVRYVGEKSVGTVSGTGKAGYADGAGVKAAFDGPTGLAAGPDGSLYVADTGNHVIRRIDAKGMVTTYAGSVEGCTEGGLRTVKFREPTGLFYAGGCLYVADSGNNRICKIENGAVTVLAGGRYGEDGFVDGPAEQALFSHPQGLAVDGAAVYIADTGNGAVRVLQDGFVSTLIRTGEGEEGLWPVSPRGMAVSGDLLWVGDTFARTLFSLDTTQPLTAQEPLPPVYYPDVREGAWYAAAVSQVSALEIMGSVGHGKFLPNLQLSRGMAITILSRLELTTHPEAEIRGDSVLLDVAPGTYYARAAAWAADRGMVQSTNGRFLPGQTVTRAEFVTMLYRYAEGDGLDVSGGSGLSVFEDGASVPSWAAPALQWAYGAGILRGERGGRLAHEEILTRAEAAVFLQRYLDWTKSGAA